ncbi:MAG: hypothetical protein WBE72_19095 [Terracidiphilus sp.]
MDTRPHGEATLPAQEQCERQIQRILRSATFRNASMLQQLLQFLAAKAFDHGSETLKEYTIGVEALSRPQDFDPKTDTIVRVQIHRLRQKLKEYYDNDGNRDPILVDIPKGHYLPSFEAATITDPDLDHNPAPQLEAQVAVPATYMEHSQERRGLGADAEQPRLGRPFFIRASIVAACAILVFASGLWIGGYRRRSEKETLATSSASNLARPADPVKAFWTNFLGNDTTPVIAYPDAVFLLDNFNDLFRFRRGATDDRGAPVDPHLAQQFASNPALVARAGQLYYENSYLGFGELKAVGMLSNLFGQMGLKPVIKPSRELTVDDLKQHNVIMLGSSSQNIAVAQFSTMGDFSFKNPYSQLEQWRGEIVNAHPRPNEASTYRTERDPNTQVLKADYSLITVQPGVVPGRYIADLGGLDTTGSEGAVLFATSKQGIDELSRILATSGEPVGRDAFPTFQVLLKVRLERGYDVLGASLVTVHMLTPEHGGSPDGSISPASTQ